MFSPETALDPDLLEFSACGYKEISAEDLIDIIKFVSRNTTQKQIFIDVIKAMTSEQRSNLLRFCSGRTVLPPKSAHFRIEVDFTSSHNVLPTGATCFNRLHLPIYDNFEVAYRLILIAIQYTGSIELS